MSDQGTNKGKYPSELSDKSWHRLKHLLPKPKKKEGKVGRPPTDLREIINGILYVLRSRCSWRMLRQRPTANDYPAWQTVSGYFNSWSKAHHWEKINTHLVKQLRQKTLKPDRKKHWGGPPHRKPKPSAGSIDSQNGPPPRLKTQSLNQQQALACSQLSEPFIVKQLEQLIKRYDKQLKDVKKALKTLIQEDEPLRLKVERLCAIKG